MRFPLESLKRSMKSPETTFLTLSLIAPASSIFAFAPLVIAQAGSGAFLSFLMAGLVSVLIAFVYAELSSAFPLAGGEYAIIWRILGPLPGFILLGLILVTLVLVVALVALSAAHYLNTLKPHLAPAITGPLIIVIIAVMSILNIRMNAKIAAFFLLFEVFVLTDLPVLGFAHSARPILELCVHPTYLDARGALVPAPITSIALGTVVALSAYAGFGSAVYFGEETINARRRVVRAIFYSLGMAIVGEALSVTAVLVGSNDLPSLLHSENPLTEFIAARGGSTLENVVTFGIAVALINADLVIVLLIGRLLWSTSRDGLWLRWINQALSWGHNRFRSPYVATCVAGGMAVLACTVNLQWLIVVTSTSLAVTYSTLCVAVVVARCAGASGDYGMYRMPLFPLPPILGLAVLGYVIFVNWADPQIGRPGILTTMLVMVIAAVYYLLVLRRRGPWILRGPSD
jgi:amino acid transporter